MKVECSKCNHISKLNPTAEMRGKSVKFRCKNSQCDQLIHIQIPHEVNAEGTVTVTGEGAIQEIEYANLIVKSSSHAADQEFRLNEGHYVIGRKSSSKFPDIEIDTEDSNMSRLHCIISAKRDKLGLLTFILKDNKSKNGVYLNDRKLSQIEEVFLMEGDTILLGETTLFFKPKYIA